LLGQKTSLVSSWLPWSHLHVIHFHVFFQKNVFGFQISVDNALLVAIVDATQEVIYQFGSILFREFGALDDFIE
jgi:hypothetical protein